MNTCASSHGDLLVLFEGLWAELDVEQLGIFRLSDLDEACVMLTLSYVFRAWGAAVV